MSGSNTMCAVTALLETGTLPVTGAQTLVRIDTAAGLVEAVANVHEGKVTSVRVHNVPSFAVELDRCIKVQEYGEVAADVAFGGQFYVQAPASALGVELGPENARAIVRAGAALLAAAREQVTVRHPEKQELSSITLVMLHGAGTTPDVSGRNSVVLPNGRLDAHDPETWRGSLDRSPCGTGTSARLACLHARGELGVGQPFIHQGVLGTTFRGVVEEETRVGSFPAVIPSIEGRAWITGYQRIVIHPDDPFPRGYTVPDIWA
jgi:proline racemase